MTQVAFIFVTGTSWLDAVVTNVTKSRWSHAALLFAADNLLVEALAGQGLILQTGNKYDGWMPQLTISRSVSQTDYRRMLNLSREWEEKKIAYGYRTCMAIGLKELFGQWAGRLVLGGASAQKADSLVCSELLVKLWRITSPAFLPGKDPRLVSPDELYQALQKESEQIKLTN